MAKHRVQLCTRMTSRDYTAAKDGQMRNMYREEDGQSVRAVKRPGLLQSYTVTAGTAQGCFSLNGAAYVIVNDMIYNVDGSYSSAIPTVGTPSQPYDIISEVSIGGTVKTILKSQTGLWVFTVAAGAVKVTNVNYPASTCLGIALLDATFYVLDKLGNLMGSAINDPTVWTALNTISIDQGLGNAVAVRRHLNYVIVFGEHGSQAFYDAANPSPGSPLSPASNVQYLIGCALDVSLASVDDTTIFMGKGRQTGRSIVAFQGLSLVPISSPFVEKLLDQAGVSTIPAYGLRINGHSFYILTLPSINKTLAYDLTTKDWQFWTTTISGVEGYFKAAFPLLSGISTSPFVRSQLMQDLTTGAVYTLSPSVYQDAANPITCVIQTSIFDGGVDERKFFTSMSIIADTSASTALVSYSDDDYTTYNTPRSVDMSVPRKQLRALGSARFRSFRITHTANTPLRIEAADFEVNT